MPQVPGSDRVANDVPDTVKVPRDDEDSSVGIERQGRGDAVKGGVAHAESAAGKLAQAGLVVPDRQPGRDPFTVDVIKLASEEEVSLHGIPGQRQDRRCCPVAHELPPLQRCPHLLICVEVSDVEDADELVAIPHARVERPAGEKIAILVDEQRLHRHARGERPSTQPAPHLLEIPAFPGAYATVLSLASPASAIEGSADDERVIVLSGQALGGVVHDHIQHHSSGRAIQIQPGLVRGLPSSDAALGAPGRCKLREIGRKRRFVLCEAAHGEVSPEQKRRARRSGRSDAAPQQNKRGPHGHLHSAGTRGRPERHRQPLVSSTARLS
mmetsp:Transcript_18018/g.68324  ORF Transcript_18018/g.68324 Transcript_18018/m.68324 type:complete len:326 (-) Transcript_18018:14-991(-)